MYRGVNIRRSHRKRHDSSEESVHLDLDKDPAENLRDILFHVVKKEGVCKGRKLGYLNCLVKLGTRCDLFYAGFTTDEVFCCLRVALFHESAEVRAGGLRALRYLLKDESCVEALRRLRIHWFIARSLDIILDNRVERVHALRLARKIICVSPRLFPRALVYCLVAIANDGADEKDSLLRACLGTLSELVLLNPLLCYECGVLPALLRAVMDGPHPQVNEAILSVVLSLLNTPQSRGIMANHLSFHHLMAPLTDAHYKHSHAESTNPTVSEPENRARICRQALASVLRAWPGLVYFCRPDHSGIQTMVEMLYLPHSDLRREIILLFFDLFSLPVPDWTDDFNAALLSSDPSASHDSWQLYEGFVAAEGLAILPYVGKYRTNLVENYLALLLLVFVNAGVLEALVDAVTTGDDFISIQATILLGQILHLCSQLMPPDFNHHCQCLPTLISMATSTEISALHRNKASNAVSLLERLHVSKRRGPVPYSLFLDQLLQFTSPSVTKKNFFKTIIGKASIQHYLKRETDSLVLQAIKDSQVLTKNHSNWDWALIGSILKSPGDVLLRLEETSCRHFISNLIGYFKPYGNLFPQLKLNDFAVQEICIVGCHLIDFLLVADETRAHEMISDFLSELNRCFSGITNFHDKPANNSSDPKKQYYAQSLEDDASLRCSVLRPSSIVNTGQFYFLFLGRLSNSNKGRKWLEKTELFQHILEMVGHGENDIYVKLIVSSLDYTTDSFSRTLLTKVLTASSDSCRLYATNYLGVLLRAGLMDFRKWAVELLVTQLYDKSKAVSLAAIKILDEACEIPDNLESLIKLRPSLLHLGEQGLLLMSRFLSVPTGFNYLNEANFLAPELDRWKSTNNFKYAKIVEERLNEAMSRHRRGANGTYGRHSSNIRHRVGEAFVPVHLYGQLSQHSCGVAYLKEKDCLSPLYNRIRYPSYLTDASILHLKAALWAVGHVGGTFLGLPLIQEAEVIPHIVKMAADAPVLSVRGVCFYVLGLVSSTTEGANILSLYGWDAVRHHRHDKWPLVPQLDPADLCPEESVSHHGHTWSVSSVGSHVSDLLTWGLMRRRREDSESSNPGAMDTVTEEEPFLERPRNTYIEEESRDRSFTVYKEYHESPIGSGNNTLPRNIKFSPHHQLAVVDTRPRSASDGRPEVRPGDPAGKNVSGLLSGSHDSGTGEDRTVYRSELLGCSKEERSDSNESAITSTKSRSGSCTDSTTSGVSSCDSNPNRTSHVEHAQRLSPIPSSTSLNTLVSKADPPVPPLQRSATLVQSPTSPLGFPTSFSYTSARDALGYATLRAIQRRRTQSFGDEEDSSSTYLRRHSKAQSHDPRMEPVFFIGENGSMEESSRRTSIESQTLSMVSNPTSETILVDKVRFMGLSLPQDTARLLMFPVDPIQCHDPVPETPAPTISWLPHISKEEETTSLDGLDLHTDDLCLVRHSAVVFAKPRVTPRTPDKGVFRSNSKDAKDCNVVSLRREVLRLVTSLSSSVGSQQWEKGLLGLKQKFPEAFQDLCLYSELCLQMEQVRFRLNTRRFLQELFLDIRFDQLGMEAEAILNVQPSFVSLPCTEEMDA